MLCDVGVTEIKHMDLFSIVIDLFGIYVRLELMLLIAFQIFYSDLHPSRAFSEEKPPVYTHSTADDLPKILFENCQPA